MTVDPASGHVITATGNEVREFDASGPSSANPAGLDRGGQRNQGSGDGRHRGTLYVSREGLTHLDVYGPVVTMPIAET